MHCLIHLGPQVSRLSTHTMVLSSFTSPLTIFNAIFTYRRADRVGFTISQHSIPDYSVSVFMGSLVIRSCLFFPWFTIANDSESIRMYRLVNPRTDRD